MPLATQPHHSLPPPSAEACPLCGQPNQCAIAAGLPAQSCWCMARVIAPEALAAVPTEQRGRVCICPACGSSGTQQGSAGGDDDAVPRAPI
ncbi:MAG: hypothetical protein EOO27_50795 [Comamonadaceae bacterium]|nr:MAG: hypothetical protein EOO27_50795 [Comamonadaceae bacterium]